MYICETTDDNIHMKKKKINPSRYFKRFLKENGLFPFYQRSVKPKEGIREFFRRTNPTDYLVDPPITNSLSVNERLYVKYSLESHSEDWRAYYEIYPCINDIKNKFIMFLKKRSAYELYLNCFSPYYVNQRVTYINRMAQWNSRNKKAILLNPNDDGTSWEQLNPECYLTDAFDMGDTIKPSTFWKDLNDKWQYELKRISKK